MDGRANERAALAAPVPRAAAVPHVEIDGETVVLDARTGAIHRLDPLATVVWSCLDGTGTVAELCEDLAAAFNASPARVVHDVLGLLDHLATVGLLEGHDPTGYSTYQPPTAPPGAAERLAAAAVDGDTWSYRSPTFAALDFRFSLRTNDDELGRHLATIFGSLATDGDPEYVYSIHDRGDTEDPRRRFATYLDDERIDASPRRRHVIALMTWHVNRQAVAASGRYLLLHAGAVALGEHAVVLPAPPDSGKTTLVTALLAAGFEYVTDEAVAVDPETLSVRAFPKALALDPGSWPLFSELRPEVPEALVEEVPAKWHVDPRRLATIAGRTIVTAVVLPRYSPAGPSGAVPIAPADAAIALLENSFNARVLGQIALDVVATIARRAPAYRLTTHDMADDVEAVRAVLCR